MLTGIVLAGGCSSRAQTNKLLLSFKDRFLIDYTIEPLLSFVDHLIIVTGFYDKDIRKHFFDFDNIEIRTNHQFDEGMFSSILCGIKNVDSDVLIIPGDCPLVKKDTIRSIIDGKKDIRIPQFNGKNGHPIFIKASLIKELSTMPIDFNLKAFRNLNDYEIILVSDSNILNDIDTLDDFYNLTNK